MKKIALVLSGGGFRGAFQLGALQYLSQNWQQLKLPGPNLHFDVIAGVSVGALNGLLVASGKMKELEQLWADVALNGASEIYTSTLIRNQPGAGEPEINLDTRQLFDLLLPELQELKLTFLEKIRLLGGGKARERTIQTLLGKLEEQIRKNISNFRALASNTPLREKLKSYAQKATIQNCIYRCGYVSLDNGKYYSFRHNDFLTDEDFANAVLASASIPLIWEPVSQIKTIYGSAKSLVDGGIKTVSPLGDVIEEIDKDENPESEYLIIIINCSSGQVEPGDYANGNILEIAIRALNEIALTEIFNNDLEHFLTINSFIRQAREAAPGFSPLNLFPNNDQREPRFMKLFNSIIIQPAMGVMGHSLAVSTSITELRRNYGFRQAETAMHNYLKHH